MNHELHAQQFSGFIPQESLKLGEGLGDSSGFKIDDLLTCASLTCSDGLREILSFLLKKNRICLENCYNQVARPLF